MTKVGLPIKSTGEKSSFEEMIGGSDAGELPATRLSGCHTRINYHASNKPATARQEVKSLWQRPHHLGGSESGYILQQ